MGPLFKTLGGMLGRQLVQDREGAGLHRGLSLRPSLSLSLCVLISHFQSNSNERLRSDTSLPVTINIYLRLSLSGNVKITFPPFGWLVLGSVPKWVSF